MQKIEPKYATFKQSVKLREKGFDEECKYYYDIEFEELTFHIGDVADVYKNSELKDKTSAPEQWQIIEWLRLNHGIWISVDTDNFKPTYNATVYELADNDYKKSRLQFIDNISTPQKAYSEAFDYILNNLI